MLIILKSRQLYVQKKKRQKKTKQQQQTKNNDIQMGRQTSTSNAQKTNIIHQQN